MTASLAEVIAATSGYMTSDGPNDLYPAGGFVPEAERRRYIEAALAGIELGAYDRRIVVWVCQWDDYTARLVVSLLVRARRAGYAEAVADLPSPEPGISGLNARTPNGEQ